MKKRGTCIWFTGLPCAGKTTLAKALMHRFKEANLRATMLDGDEVRKALSSDLGFSPTDRERHLRRVAYVVSLLVEHGIYVLCAFVSPNRDFRDELRRTIGEPFVEVFVNAPLAVCKARDVKGQYRLALQGMIPNFTGVDASYEPPILCDIRVDTDVYDLPTCVESIWTDLEERGFE